MKSFEFFQNSKLVFGAGKVSEVGQLVKDYGKNCLLVTTRGNGALRQINQRVIRSLQNSGLKVAHFDGVTPNPTTEEVTQGAEMAASINAEVIIGLGGGSSMDAAKAIAVEASHEGASWDYLFYKNQPDKRTLPIIAISTTSGTGSQVTQVAVVTNTQERDKSALFNNLLYPKVSIIDPELMISAPTYVSASTGFDVLCHAFESLLHPKCGAYVELLAKEAIRIVVESLPQVLIGPTNLEARSAMAWADTLAGLSIANAGVTLPHGMGMAIGGMYPHVAHGQALAIVYPACMTYTWEKAVEPHAFLARTLKRYGGPENDREAAKLAPVLIKEFIESIGLFQKLSDMKVPESELEALARQSMRLPDYENNPKVATLNDMLALVEDSY